MCALGATHSTYNYIHIEDRVDPRYKMSAQQDTYWLRTVHHYCSSPLMPMKCLILLTLALFPTASSFSVPASRTALRVTKGFFKTMGPTTAAVGAAQQFAPQAVSLFNNMKTPASILAGALVGLGIASPLPIETPEGKVESRFQKTLRLAYTVVGVASLLSELMSVMWSTVAVNKMIETDIAPAASVWALLQRDFDLEWAAVNAHFVLGMFGFCFLIGTRAYFQAGGGLMGQSVAGLAGSGLLLMVSIVNRGVASGGGAGTGFGGNVLSLIAHYALQLVKRATSPGTIGPLELASLSIFTLSLAQAARGIASRSASKEKTS